MTGVPHQPMNAENVNPGAPNNWPSMPGIVQKLRRGNGSLPAAVRLPHRIFNTDGSVWPGQDAGFLGHNADPWLLRCQPASPDYPAPEFSRAGDVPLPRLSERQSLLTRVNRRLDAIASSGMVGDYDHQTRQAFGLLSSDRSRNAFNLELEPGTVRDRYGRSQ